MVTERVSHASPPAMPAPPGVRNEPWPGALGAFPELSCVVAGQHPQGALVCVGGLLMALGADPLPRPSQPVGW